MDEHPTTGAAQIVEIHEEVVVRCYIEEAGRKPPIFPGRDDVTPLSKQAGGRVGRSALRNRAHWLDISGILTGGRALMRCGATGRSSFTFSASGRKTVAALHTVR